MPLLVYEWPGGLKGVGYRTIVFQSYQQGPKCYAMHIEALAYKTFEKVPEYCICMEYIVQKERAYAIYG